MGNLISDVIDFALAFQFYRYLTQKYEKNSIMIIFIFIKKTYIMIDFF